MPRLKDHDRWLLALIATLLTLTVGYVFYRAFILRVDQWDAFLYLNNTRRFLGVQHADYSLDKPPVIPALFMPVVDAVRDGPPDLSKLIAPHLFSGLLSVIAMGAVFLAFRGALGWRLALVGVVLTIGNRIFMRYAPLVMSDIVSCGWVAATYASWLHARTRREWRWFALTGVCIGLAAATRYQFATLPFAIALAEAAASVREGRINDRRWLGGTFASVLSGVVFLVCLYFAFSWIQRPFTADSVKQALDYAAAGASREWPHEEWWHYFPMLAITVSPIVLASAVIGVGIGLVRRRPRDFLFLGWVLFVGGPLFRIDHNESRYLYAAFPGMYYFALLPLEELLRTKRMQAWLRQKRSALALKLAGTGLLVAAIWPGIDQVRLDTDPFFEEDVLHASAAWLVEHHPEGTPYVWYGRPHNLHPEAVHTLYHDEFFNMFNFGHHEFEYFAGVSMDENWQYPGRDPVAGAIRLWPNGVAFIAGTLDDWNTRELIEHGTPTVPIETYAVTRHDLARTDAGWSGDGMTLRREADHAIPAEDYGEVRLVLPPRQAQRVTLEAGRAFTVPNPEAPTITIYTVEHAVFP